MTQSNTPSPRWSEVLVESHRGSWQLKSARMKRFLEEGKKESVLLFVKERIVGAYTLIRARRSCLRDVDRYIVRLGAK